MGKSRTGAPTWAKHIHKACQLSHLPGFAGAVGTTLGGDAAELLAAWGVFCTLFEFLWNGDDWPWQIDYTAPREAEDITPI